MTVSREGFIVQYTDRNSGKVWYISHNSSETDASLAKVYIRVQDANNMAKKCENSMSTSTVIPTTLTLAFALPA